MVKRLPFKALKRYIENRRSRIQYRVSRITHAQLIKRLSTINTQSSTSRTLRVAIVGCGKVADQHVHALQRIPHCQIAALCDRELLMAQQLGERFAISQCFSDLNE